MIDYIKDEKSIGYTEIEYNEMLIQGILSSYNDIKNARNNYEYAEGELIDYYLYIIKANQSKINYLIKLGKKNGIQLDRIKKIEKYLSCE